METGVDCIEIKRFQGIETDIPLQKKIFTPGEIQYCISKKSPAKHFAARFAAKEAIIKALSQINIDTALNEIEIYNDQIGRPHARILDTRYRNIVIKISLTHSDTIAMAFALIE